MAAVPVSRRTAALAVAAAAVALTTRAAAAWSSVRGNGVRRTEARALSGFTGIAMAVPGQLELRLGATEGVTIEADENLLPLIETTVSRGILHIRTRRGEDIDPTVLRIVVQARQVELLSLAGSGSISADPLKASALKVDVSGSGSVSLQHAEIEELSVSMAGSGSASFGGKARTLKVSVAGSGNVSAAALQADEAKVNMAGSGLATVSARSSLKASIAGSGTVRYHGDPKVERSIAGSGDIQRVGPMPS